MSFESVLLKCELGSNVESRPVNIQNNLLTTDNPTRINRINLWLNVSLLSGFIIYQLVVMISGDNPLNLNPLKQIFYILLVFTGLPYLVVRASKVNSAQFAPMVPFFFFIVSVVLFGITPLLGSWPPGSEITRAIWFAPWAEESHRFNGYRSRTYSSVDIQ